MASGPFSVTWPKAFSGKGNNEPHLGIEFTKDVLEYHHIELHLCRLGEEWTEWLYIHGAWANDGQGEGSAIHVSRLGQGSYGCIH